jgi:hypothetical protein
MRRITALRPHRHEDANHAPGHGDGVSDRRAADVIQREPGVAILRLRLRAVEHRIDTAGNVEARLKRSKARHLFSRQADAPRRATGVQDAPCDLAAGVEIEHTAGKCARHDECRSIPKLDGRVRLRGLHSTRRSRRRHGNRVVLIALEDADREVEIVKRQ